ncbi:MAG: hypothetical protein Ct9H300mP13_1240 [Gammaproteobacteria bacterium]|nr:MAG: hypothetical protein Ct9H300mP13_1240 [Gammaproteobacteria bacterium]
MQSVPLALPATPRSTRLLPSACQSGRQAVQPFIRRYFCHGFGPIEDKPVRHYRPGSQVLSVGSYGCSFRCGGCHNLEISWGEEALDALARGQSKAAFADPQQLVNTAIEARVQGIAFTYSEPAVWLEYVLDVCEAAKRAGLLLFTFLTASSQTRRWPY